MDLKKLLFPGTDARLLPESSVFLNAVTREETISARELLGVTIHPVKGGAAGVRSTNGGATRVIAYHQSSKFTDGSGLDIRQAYKYTSNLTMLLRLVKHYPASFVRHVQNEKDGEKTARTEFLDDVMEWALPRKGKISGHDLLLWGDLGAIIPENREETASLHGKIVSYLQAASVLRSVILSTPMSLEDAKYDLITKSYDAVWYAAPRKVFWYPDFYSLPDSNLAYAFWSGVVSPENIRELMDMGDILLYTEVVEGYLYATAILRVVVPIRNGTADFSSETSQLMKLGKWERRTGADLKKAFQAFVPGSAPPPAWDRHSVHKPNYVLSAIQKSLKNVGDKNGDTMSGFIDDEPFFLNNQLRPSRIYLGPSKVGKSTLAAAHVLQTNGCRVIWIPLTAGQFESAPHWVERFEGTVINLNLPDAYTLHRQNDKQNGTRPTRVDMVAKQEELHVEDKEAAEKTVAKLEAEWYQRGKIVGLPLTFRVKSGDTVRLLNWYNHFLTAMREAWKRWYELTGELATIVADNFSALKLSDNDPLLGELPAAIGENLGLNLAWLVSNGRNIGLSCWITTHSKEDLDHISTGLFNQFGLCFNLKHNDFTFCEVSQPKDRDVLVPKLYIKLPYPIKRVVERREPNLDELPWTQKEVSAD